jgi:hypothetical protein
MPLELGIFMGAKRYGRPAQREKRLPIFDTEKYRYQKFISDLAGMDIHAHGGSDETALIETRHWLSNVSRRQLLGERDLLNRYAQFRKDLPTGATHYQSTQGTGTKGNSHRSNRPGGGYLISVNVRPLPRLRSSNVDPAIGMAARLCRFESDWFSICGDRRRRTPTSWRGLPVCPQRVSSHPSDCWSWNWVSVCWNGKLFNR